MKILLAGLLVMTTSVWAESSLPMDTGQYVKDEWPCEDAPDSAAIYYTGLTIDSITACDIHSVTPETSGSMSVELSCINRQSQPAEMRFTTVAHIKVINRKTFEWRLTGDLWRFRWCAQ